MRHTHGKLICSPQANAHRVILMFTIANRFRPNDGVAARKTRGSINKWREDVEMTRRLALSVVLMAGFSAATVRAQAPRVHELPLRPETVHWGYYDPKIPPALRVASGDRVRVETMVAGGLQRLRLAGVPE